MEAENLMLATVTKLAANKKQTNNKQKTQKTEKKETTATVANTDNATEAKNLNLDWNNPSWDLFLIAFFAIGSLLYGISLGKDKTIGIMVSIYMSLGIVQFLPDFVVNLKINDNVTFQITAFLAIFVIIFFLLSRSAVLNSLNPSGQGKWYQVIIFGILHVGLLVTVSMSFMPEVFINKFAPITQFVFTNEWSAFGWVIAPIIAMIVFGGSDE